MPEHFDTDVFVIGGGPAGLATAIAARQQGFRVTLADSAAAPADKCCGEGLMPDGVAALRELGVAIPSDSGRFRGIRFFDQGHAAEGLFAQGCGFGVRRTVLHRLLLDRARQCGVECQFQRHITGLGDIRARWIVGADGYRSRVRQWADLERVQQGTRRFGFRRHFRVAQAPDCVEIHWREGFQVFVTPIGPDAAGVATIAADPHARIERVLAQLPQLRDSLGEPLSAERGAITGNLRLRAVFRDNVALVGDASGAVDAITGEGLSTAFRQSILLAAAMAAGDLHAYQRAHGALLSSPRAMARVLLFLAGHAAARHTAVRMLEAWPGIFRVLLTAHGGEPPAAVEAHR